MELYDLIFWLSFVLHNPKISPDASLLLHTQLPKGASPLLPFWSPPSSPRQELKIFPFKLFGTFNVKPLQCSSCSDLQKYKNIRTWRDHTLGFGVFLHSIFNHFEIQTFFLKSCQKCGFQVVFISPFILLCIVYRGSIGR